MKAVKLSPVPDSEQPTPKLAVEKGIPIPASRGGGVSKYPWADMTEVGDSFFVPNGPRGAIYTAAIWYGTRHEGMKFACRTVIEDGVTGVRVWRTA